MDEVKLPISGLIAATVAVKGATEAVKDLQPLLEDIAKMLRQPVKLDTRPWVRGSDIP